MLTRKIQLVMILVFMTVSPSTAGPKQKVKTQKSESVALSRQQILARSHVSYVAEGGFTGVESYRVLISCVDGKISTMAVIHDPRLSLSGANPLRRTSSMSAEAYLDLWARLQRLSIFEKTDAPAPKFDVLDEFTITYEAKVGATQNQFSIIAPSRPETAQYHTFRHLLDAAADMHFVWNSHQNLAKVINNQ